MFREEFEYFKTHQTELVKKYEGKVLVIKGENILGVYDSPLEALSESVKENEIGSFMIQPCEPGPEAYTVTISTLGLFS